MFRHFFFENRTVYEIMWKYIVESVRPQVTIGRTHIACWITNATNTHLEYVILIAFPLQQWLHECASLLRYTYIAHLVLTCSVLCDVTADVTFEISGVIANLQQDCDFCQRTVLDRDRKWG